VKLRPEDVFTPATPVQEDMFAARRHLDLEDRVASALSQPGRQIVLYGDTGVGKTSLVNHLLRQAGLKGERIECGAPFDDMLAEALSRVASDEDFEQVLEKTGTAEAGVSLFAFKSAVSGSVKTTTRTRPTARSFQGAVIDALEGADVRVLFLDNFENVFGSVHERETIRSVDHLLKSLADRPGDSGARIKAVVAGIPMASETLIDLDEATARRVAQIEVTRMPREELDQILVRGESKLGISFEGVARQLILNYSDGFPYYTHLLALHSSRRAIAEKHVTVDVVDFDAALAEALSDCILTLRIAYARAVETSGSVKIRKSIMEAVASFNDAEVPFKAIREVFLKRHPEYVDLSRLNFLSTAIKPLKEVYGILSDKGLPKSKRNLYRFTNPLMRGYIRLRMRSDAPGRPMLWDSSEGLAIAGTVT
jgi:hypothetical protein